MNEHQNLRHDPTALVATTAEPPLSLDHPHVLRAIQDYRAALEAGEKPEREKLLAEFGEIASELAACLDGLEFIHVAGPGLQGPNDSQRPPDDSRDAIRPTAMLGDFRILRELGRGGMGIVYEAEQLSLGRRVALKVLPFAAVMDHKQLQRFKNEATAAAHLDHPNIVHVYSVGNERGVHFYAMQFIDGQTLAEVVRELRRASGLDQDKVIGNQVIGDQVSDHPDRSLITDHRSPSSTSPHAALSTARSTNPKEFFRTVARLGIQAAEALDHAHQVGIIHRDIKPGNLMLDTRGNLWITDFGLARVGTDANLTMTGDLIGTLRYMSPEQALAKRVIVDLRTDIYSLGVTLYELLTLQPAFAGEDRHELLRQIAFDEPRLPRRINERIPPELETIVLKAIAKNPSERYASARELAEDLERLLRDEPIKARRPTLVQRARKWSRRHQPLVWSAAVCVLVALAALAGSIGWFAGERAARWAAVERQVDLALEEATQLMQQAKWPEARAWLERADGLLAGGGSRDEVRRRVSALRNDLDLVQRLEEVCLEKATVLDGGMTYAEVDARYAKVFREYGIEFDELGVDAAAERIRQSGVCSELTVMIDDWAIVRRRAQGRDTASWKKLLAVARGADGDDIRTLVRDALNRADSEALAELASQDEGATLPSPTVVLLADTLAESGQREKAVSLLRCASRARPGDFWIHYAMADHLGDVRPPQWGEMVRSSRVALALRPDNAAVARLFAESLCRNGEMEDAINAAKRAVRLNDSSTNYITLGTVLFRLGLCDEAIGAFRTAIRLEPDEAITHSNLGAALHEMGALDEAIAEFRLAVRLKPDFAEAHTNLGVALREKGALDEAIAEYRQAIRQKPDCTEAHTNLGVALSETGALDEAIAEYREAIRLEPDAQSAHNNLGDAHRVQGALDEAIAEYRLAIRLKPDDSAPHSGLCGALEKKGALDEAVAEGRAAIRLKPADHVAHYNLGNALKKNGALDEAIEEYRVAIRLKPDLPEAHCNLGGALQRMGRFSEALTTLRIGHELGSRKLNWPYPSDQWVAEAERLVELDEKLAAVLRGEAHPSGAAERIRLAWHCLYYKHHNAAAARFYAEAFAADPEPAADLDKQHRYNAACAAALAGCGQGVDAGSIGDGERARLRQQALDWLRADLESWRKVLEGDSADARAKVVGTLKHWQTDSDLAGVRDTEALAKLPDAEREAWGRLWAEVLKEGSRE